MKAKKINKHREKLFRAFSGFLALLILTTIACVVSPSLKKQPPPPTPENKMTSLERDVRSMETADFEYILVFRRKDGGIFNSEDKKYLKDNSPPETNRFVVSDDDRAVIAGSSFPFEPKILEVLGKRFEIENLSVKPEESKP